MKKKMIIALKIISYLTLVLVTISSCKKEECDRLVIQEQEVEKIDTLECDIIKNKGSLVTAVCEGDTLTIVDSNN